MSSRLTKNLGLKALSLLIAFGLWVLVAGEQETVRVFNAALDIALADRAATAGDAPAKVQVRLRGPEVVLRSLSDKDLSVPVDLSDAPAGSRAVRMLGPRAVRGVPSGVAVDAIVPDRISLAIERRIQRTVPVEAALEGAPAPGYRVTEVLVEPSRIRVEGPESEVLRLASLRTVPIALRDRREGITLLTGVSLDSPRTRILDTGPVRIEVRIEKEIPAQ